MGRAKDVIIRGGHNIDPRAIEDAALGFLASPSPLPSDADAYAGEVPILPSRRSPASMSIRRRCPPSCWRRFSNRRPGLARCR